MNRQLIIHLILMVLGYILAVLVSSTITVVIIFTPTFSENVVPISVYGEFGQLFVTLILASCMTAVFALPGWLISVMRAEYNFENRKVWFGIAGIATTILAHCLSLFFIGYEILAWLIIIGSLIGGYFGGLMYWAIIGKKSGNWRANGNGVSL